MKVTHKTSENHSKAIKWKSLQKSEFHFLGKLTEGQ